MLGQSAGGSQEGGSASQESAAAFMRMDQVDFEIEFFQSIIERTPNNVDVLRVLGNHYTTKGYFTRGLRVDKRLVRLVPDDPFAWYNLACSYSLVHLNGLALDSLEKSVELGYTELEHMQTDTDLDNIRREPRYWLLVRQLKGRPGA